MARVGFIGLGVMGFHIAGYLSKSGHKLAVYNRTNSKVDNWLKKFLGENASSPADVARNSDFVFCCVGNDDDLRDVTIGDEGAFQEMKSDTVFVDHTTASATATQELAALAGHKGFHFIDAPVSGGQVGAEKGKLTVMCGGDEQAYSLVEPFMSSYSISCKLMGKSGSGQLTKMVNQICIAGVLQSLSEALLFSDKAGLDSNQVLEVISKGAAGSWQMENRGQTMVDNQFEFGFAVDWMRKDLGICLDQGNKIGASLPITALVNEYYKDVKNMGGGRWDTSSLIARLRKLG
jgi:3-hydroxyisobutyrate dehydrogenase